MSEKVERDRLNLYVGKNLMERLCFCAERYGVSRTQLAVMLIGQGVSGIEKSFSIFDGISKDFSNSFIDTKNDYNK